MHRESQRRRTEDGAALSRARDSIRRRAARLPSVSLRRSSLSDAGAATWRDRRRGERRRHASSRSKSGAFAALEIVEVQLVDDDGRRVRREMDRAQSLRVRSFSRRNAAFRARPRRAQLFGAGRQRRALRATRRGRSSTAASSCRSIAPGKILRPARSPRSSRRTSRGCSSHRAARSAAAALASAREYGSLARCLSRRPRAADAGGSASARASGSSSPSFSALATAAQLRRARARTRPRRSRPARFRRTCSKSFERSLPFALTGAQRRVDRSRSGTTWRATCR